MIRSMTGFGAVTTQRPPWLVHVEIRTANGRHFKVTLRTPPILRAVERDLEKLIQTRLARGTAQVDVQIDGDDPTWAAPVNEELVRSYQAAFRRLGLNETVIPLLPGVVAEKNEKVDEVVLAAVTQGIESALDDVAAMRRREGEAIATALNAGLERLASLLQFARGRAPKAAVECQRRLTERLAKLLNAAADQVDPVLIAREVAVLADRADVTEEVERLASHVAQMRTLIAGDEPAGRTLDFLTQEMLREANTLAAKSTDLELSRTAVELKAEIERLREQVANVE
jgi:uncharacterized protein (TIGR00255 family)